MNDKVNYCGMTVNERLYEAGLLDAFDDAARRRNREEMIEILNRVDLMNQAAEIADKILANPKFYGF